MSASNIDQKKETQPRKKRKSKRKANSPLNDSGQCSGQCSQTGAHAGGVSDVNKQTNNIHVCTSTNNAYRFPNPQNQPPIMNFSQQMPFNVPQQQPTGSAQSQPPPMLASNSFMNPGLSPTQITPSQQLYSMPPVQASGPPGWATELINDVKQIKVSLAKLDKIEQTVNMINLKVTELETKVNAIDVRVDGMERSCTFMSDENDDRKKDLEIARGEIKTLKTNCKTLEDQNTKLESKLTDLESRSMRENLLFYGIPEVGENENCEQLVKQLCTDKLNLPDAKDFLMDRVHRVGVHKQNKSRPIVAKFHYFRDRETVRKRSYDCSDALKQANLGIGMQWPQQVREARKSLYPVMQREKQNGKEVRMVRDKLFINGREYRQEQDQQEQERQPRR